MPPVPLDCRPKMVSKQILMSRLLSRYPFLNVVMKFRRFSRLSGFERAALIEAFLGLATTWIGLRLAGFQRWTFIMKSFAPLPNDEKVNPRIIDSAQVVSRMQQSAARNLFFQPNCLEQSIVLWWILRRRGIHSDVRIGARRQADGFKAHAWVECGGAVLNEFQGVHRHFVPFDGPIVSVETRAH